MIQRRLVHGMHAADQVSEPDIWPELSRSSPTSAAALPAGGFRPGNYAERGNMIGDHDPLEVDVHQRLHHLAHVRVAVVDQALGEMRQWRAHVTEVNLEKLLPRTEVFDHADDVLARHRAAFHPASAT